MNILEISTIYFWFRSIELKTYKKNYLCKVLVYIFITLNFFFLILSIHYSLVDLNFYCYRLDKSVKLCTDVHLVYR